MIANNSNSNNNSRQGSLQQPNPSNPCWRNYLHTDEFPQVASVVDVVVALVAGVVDVDMIAVVDMIVVTVVVAALRRSCCCCSRSDPIVLHGFFILLLLLL